MTVPTRRTEELAAIERRIVETDQDDGQKTSVMEVMTLIEAEQRIARATKESSQSGVRAISPEQRIVITGAIAVTGAPVSIVGAPESARVDAPAPPSDPEPSVAPPVSAAFVRVAPLAQSVAPPSLPAPPRRGRRGVAGVVVTVVMLSALAVLGVGLSRTGWTVPPRIAALLPHLR